MTIMRAQPRVATFHLAMGIGSEVDAEVKSGLGTRLINLLSTQMKGTMTRNPRPQGCEVQITVQRDV
jgi:two-component sensor histidine kinase